jgi:hypothetical protein
VVGEEQDFFPVQQARRLLRSLPGYRVSAASM